MRSKVCSLAIGFLYMESCALVLEQSVHAPRPAPVWVLWRPLAAWPCAVGSGACPGNFEQLRTLKLTHHAQDTVLNRNARSAGPCCLLHCTTTAATKWMCLSLCSEGSSFHHLNPQGANFIEYHDLDEAAHCSSTSATRCHPRKGRSPTGWHITSQMQPCLPPPSLHWKALPSFIKCYSPAGTLM